MIGTQIVADVPATTIRPASAADTGSLTDFFAGLSMQTRYLRFFAPVMPGPKLVRRMSGGDCCVNAVVAVLGGVVIGHAMAVDQAGPRGTRTADLGVVVADAWQGLGVGSALMHALTAGAQARGVTSLTMDVLPGNHRMLALIARHWPAACAESSGGFVTFRVLLTGHPQQVSQARSAALVPAGG